MNQDRRKNGWVLISASLQIILSIILLSVGIALGVCGFLYQSKLATIDELQFFINQKGIIEAQHLISGGTKLLKPEFLYLFLGGIVAVIGIIVLIIGIVSLIIAKKKKVVRSRIKLTLFTIIPLAIAGCSATYLAFEVNNLPDYIKYGLYGIIGAFGFCALCLMLGLLFGRSEKFMSNDNNKFAFDDSSLRNARVDVNNNVRMAESQMAQGYNMQQPQGQVYMPNNMGNMPTQAPYQQQNYMQQPRQQMPQNMQAQRVTTSQPIRNTSAIARPVQPMHGASNMQRPLPPRPMQQPQVRQNPVQPRPMQPMQARPVQPMQQRPMQQVRPMQQPQPQANNAFCPKCGKSLVPQEKICTMCGFRVIR
ncbi:MAG: hypothetical protein IJA72_04045 [Clostridia bacterium]|nr:hypothetical protein [Clostridia bacterium]